jgi:hypothetical protein
MGTAGTGQALPGPVSCEVVAGAACPIGDDLGKGVACLARERRGAGCTRREMSGPGPRPVPVEPQLPVAAGPDEPARQGGNTFPIPELERHC